MGVVLASVLAAVDLTGAEQTAEAVESLRRRIEELDQQLKILERRQELNQEATAEKTKSLPTVSVGAGGLQVRSSDSNFVFRARGYVQVDARYYPEPVPGAVLPDTFLIRRARPIFEGTVFDRFDYRVMLDFGAQASLSTANNSLLQDAYVTARLWPELQVVAGKMKEPVGLERLQSGANLLFLERGYPTQLLPNRDVGFALQGDLFEGALNYVVGGFNGVADGGSGDFDTSDRDKDVAARVFAHPFKHSNVDGLKGLGVGVSGTYGTHEGALRPYASQGLQRILAYRSGAGTSVATANIVGDGTNWRFSPQGYYYVGPFGLFAEYAYSSQEVRRDDGTAPAYADLAHSAWQVAASWFLTGEENSFKAITPKHNFAPATGGWGALEIAARVGQIDFDDETFPLFANPATSASRATSYGAGLNWHLNRNVKLSLGYDYTEFEAPTGSQFENEDEHILAARVQFGW
jgi:phosphate-selective porin OprO/OprP